MINNSIVRNSIILTAFAFVTAGLLAATYSGTADKITFEQKKAAQQALLEIVPATLHDNEMLEDTIELTADQKTRLGLTSNEKIYIAKKQGKAIAVIVPAVAPDGYSGSIKLIIGIFRDGTIAGVRTISHKETPGLGDKVDLKKSDWILSFDGKSLKNVPIEKWRVKKDNGVFDQFTGATITPRAVVNRVKQTLVFFNENKTVFFQEEKTRHESKNTTE